MCEGMDPPYALITLSEEDNNGSHLIVDDRDVQHWLLTRIWVSAEGVGMDVPGYGLEEDYKDIDVAQHVAIVRRGRITIRTKVCIARLKGAVAVVIVNQSDNVDNISDIDLGVTDRFWADNFPVLLVTSRDGQTIANRELKMQSSLRGREVAASTVEMRLLACRLAKEMKRYGVFSFIGGPVSFVISRLGYPNVVFIYVVVLIAVSARFQKKFIGTIKHEIEEMRRKHGDHFETALECVREVKEIKKVCGVSTGFVPVWLYVLLSGLVEFVDPCLDGQQVGRSFSMSSDMDMLFRNSWVHVCSKGGDGYFSGLCPAFLGLPSTLLRIFVASFVANIVTVVWSMGAYTPHQSQYYDLAEDGENDSDDRSNKLAEARSFRWLGLSMLAESLNLPLLAKVFADLCQVESGAKASVRSFFIFFCHLLFEGIPMVWFQVSLLGLAWKTSTRFWLIINLVSIASSFKAVASGSFELLSDSVAGVTLVAERTFLAYVHKSRLARESSFEAWEKRWKSSQKAVKGLVNGLYWLCIGGIIFASFILASSLVRLYGTLVCESHIFNVFQAQITDPMKGCFRSNANVTRP